jgi:hypothetical protein
MAVLIDEIKPKKSKQTKLILIIVIYCLNDLLRFKPYDEQSMV